MATAKKVKEIQKNNENFEKASPSEKRVLIAKDVIRGLKSKRLVSMQGVWLCVENDGELFDPDETDKKTELKKVLDKIPSCNVCALGGIFVSAVRRFNKLKCSKDLANPDYARMLPYLKRFFSEKQIRLIECAYEQGDGFVYAHTYGTSYGDGREFICEAKSVAEKKLTYYAMKFGRAIEDAADRMVAIMKNIIDNGGTFVPPVPENCQLKVLPGGQVIVTNWW